MTPPSATAPSPCNPEILEALEQASRKGDVRLLFQRHDVADINAAWKALSPAQRGALTLCRVFDGTIIHELDDSPG